MKQILYTLMVLCAVGLLSCRKTADNFTIKQFDDNQIQNYIKANGLSTIMKRDTSGGDTTGIYYQIINPGSGRAFSYSTKISYVYTAKTLDGNFNLTDTILNHVNSYAAYAAPNGLQLALINLAKRKGAKIRVIIPSRLAYGINGTTLSTYNTAGTVVYNTVGGNQAMDYTISVMDDDLTIVNNPISLKTDTITKQAIYDDLSIQKYMAAKGLTGYTKTAAGNYYKITQAGTGTDPISTNSTLGVDYTGTLFNGIIFDQANTTDGTAAISFTLIDNIPGWQDVLPHTTAGSKITMLVPSPQAYGQAANASGTVTLPGFSCLRFDINVISVSN